MRSCACFSVKIFWPVLSLLASSKQLYSLILVIQFILNSNLIQQLQKQENIEAAQKLKKLVIFNIW